jgi:methionine synthase II (cobalamin-independent)
MIVEELDPYLTLSIGSLPFVDLPFAFKLLGECVDIPASPQFVGVSHWEDMLLSSVDGVWFVKADEDSRVISVPLEGREDNLARFYEDFYSEDYSFLKRSPRASLGYMGFLDKALKDKEFGKKFLKTQVVGPLTFGQSVKVEGAFSLVDDPGLLEAASLALGAKLAWEAKAIRELGRTPIVFLDEPGLSGYGSAFSTLSEETVVNSLNNAARAARSLGPVIVGCHVCGNTDWGLLTKAELDIINCDAFDFMESVTLYPKELTEFMLRGGHICWGIVPTQGYDPGISPVELSNLLALGWDVLVKRGVDRELLKSRALITTSCGLGSLKEQTAKKVLELIPKVARILRENT